MPISPSIAGFNPIAWGFWGQGLTTGDLVNTVEGCEVQKGGLGHTIITLPQPFAQGSIGWIVTVGQAPGPITWNVADATSTLDVFIRDPAGTLLNLAASFLVFRIGNR